MKNPVIWILMIVLIAGAGVGGYFLWGKKKMPIAPPSNAPATATPPVSSGAKVYAKMGDRGVKVLDLQRFLNGKNLQPKLKEDQQFGPKTQAQVLAIFGSASVSEDQWKNRGLL